MGRLERQIMVGALALVGILVAVVILKGLAPRGDSLEGTGGLGELAPPLLLEGEPLAAGVEPSETPPPETPLETPPAEFWLDAAAQEPAPVVSSAIPLEIPLDGTALLPAPSPEGPRAYVIRDGDVLGVIAQRELGSVKRLQEILDLNPGLDPLALKPGSTLQLPARGAVPPAAVPGPTVEDAQFLLHTVVPGDKLWDLASHYLGDGRRYREIVAANPDVLKDENAVLKLGAKLRIPRK